jgi:hypothetical protein
MENEGLRRAYEQRKEALAEVSWGDLKEYNGGKSGIIKTILREAGWAEEDLEVVSKTSEPSERGREDE